MIDKLTAVIADIDGTLVAKGEDMMPLTKQALEIIHKHGVLFGLASGRPVSSAMYARKDEWGLSFDFDIMIGMNGGQLRDRFHDDLGEYCKMSTDVMHEILDMMRSLGLTASVYEGDHSVTTKLDEMTMDSAKRNNTEIIVGDEDRLCIAPNFNILFRFDPSRKEEIAAYAAAHPSDKYVGVVTCPFIIEFMDPRINKGLAVEMFSERNNIPLEEIMVFGDMDNDVGLMQKGGWSVCLKNGCDATKAEADAITEYDCNHDGVGHYLFDHVIIPRGWDQD